jgi:hypothetical protein
MEFPLCEEPPIDISASTSLAYFSGVLLNSFPDADATTSSWLSQITPILESSIHE